LRSHLLDISVETHCSNVAYLAKLGQSQSPCNQCTQVNKLVVYETAVYETVGVYGGGGATTTATLNMHLLSPVALSPVQIPL
jgi:hypothetical protein